jgi:hypothetical protein
MDVKEEIQAAQKTIEIAEKLEALTKKEGWKEYVRLLDQLLQQEMQALAGIKLDHSYYKKIGFLQMMFYVRELPTLVKDKKIREYLLHQGRAKACDVAMGLHNLFRKQKMVAMQKIKQIVSTQSAEHQKIKHGEEVFKQS